MAVATIESKKRILQLKREKLRREYPKLFTAKYHHKTTHHTPLRFGDRYRFMVDLYKAFDKYRKVVVRKSVQCGVTDVLVVSALEEASKGLRIFYVMPNRDLRNDFVKDRLDVLLKTVPWYKAGIKEAVGSSESIGLKHFYKGLINFVGSKSKADFVSFQADGLSIDEVDKCDQANLAMAPDRMDASDYKFDKRVGNPSIEGYGIDKDYQLSTQGAWLIKCSGCGLHQPLDFFKNVLAQEGEMKYAVKKGTIEDPYCICIKCGKALERLGPGEWVDAYPKVEAKGMHISQLFSGNVTLGSLVEKWFTAVGNELEQQLFYNSKLGLPYSASGSKMTLDVLNKASMLGESYILKPKNEDKVKAAKRVYVGIDVGKYFDVVAREATNSGKRKMVYIARIEDADTLAKVLKSLNAKIMVIDEGPEMHKVEELKLVLKKLYSCRYVKGRTLLNINKRAEDYKKLRKIRIDRTLILDSVKKDYDMNIMINPSNAKDLFNEESHDFGQYYSQMLSSTRTYVEDSNSFEWRETSADHFFHAEAYCRIAEELDDRILEYYEDVTADVANMTKEELDAKDVKSKKLIPDIKSVENMEGMRSEDFLRTLFHKTEDFLGDIKGRKKK